MEKHFCSAVIIIDPETKKILLVHHKHLHKWVQPGGHIDASEDFEASAIREVKEETGLNVRLLGERFPMEKDYIRPLGIQRTQKDDDLYISFVYPAVPTSKKLVTYQEAESNGIGWFTREELENINVFEDILISYDYVIEHYFN